MNYYEKIIQEKMNSTQVIEKGTIKGAEYFIEKVTETVKYPRPFEQVRYIGKLKKDGRVIIYTPRHENLDTCKRALEKLVDENKSMFNNSKGETNMGYYADLIKEKKEKKNGLGSRHGNVVKEFKYKGCDIAILRGYSSGPYDGTSSYGADVYKGDLRLGLDDIFYSQARAEADAKLAVDMFLRSHKNNSKEEKDNASVQDKFRHKGCMITILKKGENQYTFTIEQNGREEGTNKVYPSQDKAEREAKREVEVNWNEKEETENASEADIRAMYSQIQELKKKGIKGENIDKFYAAVNYRAAAEEHRKKYKQTGQEAYKIAAEKADRQADQWIKEINRSIRNEKEKGYYAKLAEEKQERKNYKFTDKEIADYLKSNPSSAKQYVRKKTAGKAENITIHPETLTAELEENGKIHVFKFVSDESLGFILKYIGTK